MRIIGLMSGTSCDGLDMACVQFNFEKATVDFQIEATHFVPYTANWKQRLQEAHTLSGVDLHYLDVALGQWMGIQVRNFLTAFQIENVAAIASHGHTVFHEPDKGLTLQIGNGAHLNQLLGIPVICDFRIQDVANHGQGAPLVPVGDALLFPEYDVCLNLGGFSNISFVENGQRKAFDICPVNIVLNALAAPAAFDEGGVLAAKGVVQQDLLVALNALPFYQKAWPKSLGREWVETTVWPLLQGASGLRQEDALATFSQHVILQLHKALEAVKAKRVLVTGGGAYNAFVVNGLRQMNSADIIVPNKELVDFKEAVVFALLGALRMRGSVNVWASVTGGCSDLSAGLIYH
jgi:anhydro-N-acetylmuramic acid kinase